MRRPRSVSDQFYKGVLDGQARAVFAGRIVVRREAQKTNAYQSNANLLLSADAEIDTKPELEIFADDVKCSHGATAGELDERALFYLRSRGIDPATARSLLTYAFADEVAAALPAAVGGPSGAARAPALAAGRQPRWRICCERRDASRRARATASTSSGCGRISPASHQTVHGRPLVFLDTAASAQKPQAVIDELARMLREDYANIHRGVYDLSQRATDRPRRRRARRCRGLLNAADAREIVFTRNATEGINLVAQSFVRPHVRPGDQVLITAMEHHANIVPWQLLRAQFGLELVVAPINDQGELVLDELEARLSRAHQARVA